MWIVLRLTFGSRAGGDVYTNGRSSDNTRSTNGIDFLGRLFEKATYQARSTAENIERGTGTTHSICICIATNASCTSNQHFDWATPSNICSKTWAMLKKFQRRADEYPIGNPHRCSNHLSSSNACRKLPRSIVMMLQSIIMITTIMIFEFRKGGKHVVFSKDILNEMKCENYQDLCSR